MKRIAVVAAVTGAVTFALGAPLAASQDAPVDTTTTVAETTTTVAPETTTTTAAPETTTTTVAPETTTTTIPDTVPVPPVLLFGEAITAGTLDVNVMFEDDHAFDCATTVPLDGGQVNRVNDADGDLGLVYGQAATGTGNAAVFLMELGVIPAGVGILSIDDATCSLDAIGVGLLKKSPGTMAFKGFGVGVHPGAYDAVTTTSTTAPDGSTVSAPQYARYGRYVEKLDLTANVGASAGTAQLDTEALKTFLLRPRA